MTEPGTALVVLEDALAGGRRSGTNTGCAGTTAEGSPRDTWRCGAGGGSTGVSSHGGVATPRDYLGVLCEEHETPREFVRTQHSEMPLDARGQFQTFGGTGGMLPLPKGCLTPIAFLTLQDVLEGEVPPQ